MWYLWYGIFGDSFYIIHAHKETVNEDAIAVDESSWNWSKHFANQYLVHCGQFIARETVENDDKSQCHHCDKSFGRVEHRRRHMIAIHKIHWFFGEKKTYNLYYYHFFLELDIL